MSDLDELCENIEKLSSGRPLKYTRHDDSDILTVFGESASPLDRARHGLDAIEELANTAAEHHPYWKMLNAVAESARIVLDGWNDTIPPEDLDSLRWTASSLRDAVDRESA